MQTNIVTVKRSYSYIDKNEQGGVGETHKMNPLKKHLIPGSRSRHLRLSIGSDVLVLKSRRRSHNYLSLMDRAERTNRRRVSEYLLRGTLIGTSPVLLAGDVTFAALAGVGEVISVITGDVKIIFLRKLF